MAPTPEAGAGANMRDPTKPQDEPEEVTLHTTGLKKLDRRVKIIGDDEPLIDTTVTLPKRSKKTERAIKRLMRKQQKLATHRGPATLGDLPAELLEEVLGYLRASDVLQFAKINRRINEFVARNEGPIARSIVRRRYPVLVKCFPLPKSFFSIPEDLRPALLSDSRQQLLQIHKRPYQHIHPVDPEEVCTCMTCILAWNNLNLIVDLAHWQKGLNRREPITMIPRGTNPEWNRELLARNAALVEQAMARPLAYTLILEMHLRTTISTLLRTLRGQKTVHPKRVYYVSKPEAEAGLETDIFLERNGPECYEFPYHRDNYYNLNAYVPNRKWVAGVVGSVGRGEGGASGKEEHLGEEKGRWVYYAEGAHERDLKWMMERFVPVPVPAAPEKRASGISEQAAAREQGSGGSGESKDEGSLDSFAAQFQAQASL